MHQIDVARAFSLRDRTVLVTGASSGIGRHLAFVAASAGGRVALAARRSDRLARLKEEIVAAGGAALAVTLDVSDDASIITGYAEIEREYGPIDVLVNNAGSAIQGKAIDGSREADLAVWSVNVAGPAALARRAAARWIDQARPGVIVNIGSILGLTGTVGVASYCTTKAALTNLTRALAAEWARHSIRVNALAPGYIRTELNEDAIDGDLGAHLVKRIPMRRIGSFDDLTGPFLLLASDASSFMTGSVLVVDGGQTSWA